MTIPRVFPGSEVFIPRSTNTASTPRGESTSQSVPGLKAEGFPSPHHNDDPLSHTHTHRLTDMGMHASYTYAQRHIGECFHTHTLTHTCTRLASFSFTHSIVLSALPVFIHGDPCADTISFYLNYISQLPILPRKNCFSSSLHACTRTFCQFFFFFFGLSPSTSVWGYIIIGSVSR